MLGMIIELKLDPVPGEGFPHDVPSKHQIMKFSMMKPGLGTNVMSYFVLPTQEESLGDAADGMVCWLSKQFLCVQGQNTHLE
jgi:hypothetical protein